LAERLIDQSPIGQHIAEQMEAIEKEYEQAGKKAKVGTIITIVEIITDDGEVEIRARPSDSRPWVVVGVLEWCLGHWRSGPGSFLPRTDDAPGE